MISELFAIYDCKSETYSAPFPFPNKAVAIRSFVESAGDAATRISKYPADFSLWQVGHYDDQTGKSTNVKVPIDLGSAKVLLGDTVPRDPMPRIDA